VLCHGERADGQGRRREGFDRPPRDFTNASWRASVTPAQVFIVIRDGVGGTAMPSWRTLGPAALWDLTSYVRSVSTAAKASATPSG
jgi:mono/diheme cytochrome c family protein